MNPRDLTQYAVAAVLATLIVVLLFGQLLGQPFLVFVETGSMSPTLEPNDGFVAIPALFAGEVEPGDVIVFDSRELGGGEVTTHRVEAVTGEGYLTKGDANPFLDQDGDEPPVAHGQVRSVALQLDGDLVVIPGLGATVTAVSGTVESVQERVLTPFGIDPPDIRTVSTTILVLGLALYIMSAIRWTADRRARRRSDDSPLQNALVLIAILTLVVIVPVNASMLLPSGTYQYELVSSTSPTDDEWVAGVGDSTDVTYVMRNSGHLPVITVLEPASDGVDPPDGYTYIPRGTTVETSVTMHAPDETGVHLRFVSEYRYLVVLPPSLIAALHAIHPVVALAAINATVAGAVIAVSFTTLGTDRIKVRSKRRELTLVERLKRRLPPPPRW
ncbi:S24/S26 family peptidase [Natrarchaeobaculum sulfurireducens]|uniref:Signal peptidase I n=1 Tax=Natrarchaeobaculum sulfurireducens TaxID=2044521 RepID=A0A346PV59_9EURY|nr:S24/S26 family peptidase [Natrarchaeobaculum sulfurireducens]AXR79661.1 Signal peptidase I [Natrarchaeobaculum sulfurireducens]AXR83404.1 Signal peptidase I [Natrarchaeobaculum sulfurireducens]